MSKSLSLQQVADGLNERQRSYLLAVYAEDQLRETANRGRLGAPPARVWRWIEYGPVGARWLDSPDTFLLRHVLDKAGLGDQGTGATWSALVGVGLVKIKHAHTGLIDRRSHRPIVSLLVQMTTTGRKVARILKGEPLTRPKAPPKPLSLSALRLIAYGQQYPDTAFHYADPWGGPAPVDYLIMLGISRGLIKRGLLVGEAPHSLRITAAGLALDITKAPNWRPLGVHGDRKAMLTDGGRS